MNDLPSAAELVDEIAGARCDLIHVGFEFERHERNPAGDVAKAVLAALQLQHTQPDDEGHPAPAPFHHPWGPREDASPDVIVVWEELLGVVESRAVRARLHDLLWVERAGGQPFQHARAAVEDYVAAAELGACDGLYQALTLMRALDLAREVNAQDLFGSVSGGAVRALEAEVEGDEVAERPGVSLRLLRLLADLPASDQPADLGSRLEEMHALFEGNHPHDRESVFRIQEKLARADLAEINRLQRSNVQVWIDWALEQEGGVFRRLALSMALERADTIADADDLRETIRLRMQEIGDDDLGLQEISVDTEIPAAEIEGLVESIVGDDGIEGALVRFGAWGPPTGDPRENAEAVDKEMDEFVYQSLIPMALVDDQGRTIRQFATGDEKREAALLQRENSFARLHGSLATVVLERIGEQYFPTQADLADLFETGFIGSHQADAFARAFGHYWAGRFDEAIHIALPRIEAVLRQMLVAAGGISYTEPHGSQAGHDKTLGTVLSELKGVLGNEGWRRSLLVLLTEPTGFNLRNRYLHGQIEEAQQVDAALVLQVAAYLRLLAPQDRPTQG